MADTLNIILQQLLDGQTSIEKRLVTIETALAEKRGERRVAMWLVGAGGGAIGALATNAARLLGHK